MAVVYGRRYYDGLALDMDCKICIRSELARRQWGCDEPTTRNTLEIPCVECDGFDLQCKRCEGRGREELFTCPRKSISAEIMEAIQLHSYWPTQLPYSGGVYEQPALYVRSMQWLDRAKNLLQEAEEKTWPKK